MLPAVYGQSHPCTLLPLRPWLTGSIKQSLSCCPSLLCGRHIRYSNYYQLHTLKFRQRPVTASSAGSQDDRQPEEQQSNVLIAVDNSEDSDYACTWALENLNIEGVVFHLAHCIPFVPRRASFIAPDGPQFVETAEESESERESLSKAQQLIATRYVSKFAEAGAQLQVDLLRQSGSGEDAGVGDVLCRKAEELQASALVLASHSKGAMSELFLGSISNYCVRYCTQPVLVLHPPRKARPEPSRRLPWQKPAGADAQPRPGQAPAQAATPGPAASPSAVEVTVDEGSRPAVLAAGKVGPRRESVGGHVQREVLIVVDDTAAAEGACRWAVQNLYRAGDLLHILHVIPSALTKGTYSSVGAEDWGFRMSMDARQENVWKDMISQRFTAMLDSAGVSYRVDLLSGGAAGGQTGWSPTTRIGKAICSQAEHLAAVAVVMSSHEGSREVAAYCCRHCMQPVAVLH